MTITFEQLEAEVRKLAGEKPGFIYWPDRGAMEGCRYNADNHQPGCIFGQAFARLGIKLVRDTGTIGTVLDRLGIERTDEQRRWASLVQARQDNMNTWRSALEYADADRQQGLVFKRKVAAIYAPTDETGQV